MKITLIGKPGIIQSNPFGKHRYFAWPTVARLRDGRIAVGSSGFRLAHVCPFGKAVLSFSNDEGRSFTAPAPVIDTPLDDRDTGLCPFGQSGLIVTSFNNGVAFQRHLAADSAYRNGYLDLVSEEDEKAYLGATFRVSSDNGTTFGPLYRSPITSPHGPLELRDGSIIWVGRDFAPASEEDDRVRCCRVYTDGRMEHLGDVPPLWDEKGKLLSCEPDTVELADGTLVCHIRVQRKGDCFTTYQTESTDGGRTWTEPRSLLGAFGGAPAHLLEAGGTLVSVYGYREQPYGIRAMFSRDGGKTWDTDNVIWDGGPSWDLGYPASVALDDGSLLTVFYSRYPDKESPAVILAQRWRFD